MLCYPTHDVACNNFDSYIVGQLTQNGFFFPFLEGICKHCCNFIVLIFFYFEALQSYENFSYGRVLFSSITKSLKKI